MMSELTMKELNDSHTIDRATPYEFQLDSLIWREREKWAWKGAIVGGLVTSLFWLIALGF